MPVFSGKQINLKLGSVHGRPNNRFNLFRAGDIVQDYKGQSQCIQKVGFCVGTTSIAPTVLAEIQAKPGFTLIRDEPYFLADHISGYQRFLIL